MTNIEAYISVKAAETSFKTGTYFKAPLKSTHLFPVRLAVFSDDKFSHVTEIPTVNWILCITTTKTRGYFQPLF